eukprot:COSAG02_NODE_680_length_18551_cov_16.648060_12_plen_49_part_00
MRWIGGRVNLLWLLLLILSLQFNPRLGDQVVEGRLLVYCYNRSDAQGR